MSETLQKPRRVSDLLSLRTGGFRDRYACKPFTIYLMHDKSNAVAAIENVRLMFGPSENGMIAMYDSQQRSYVRIHKDLPVNWNSERNSCWIPLA